MIKNPEDRIIDKTVVRVWGYKSMTRNLLIIIFISLIPFPPILVTLQVFLTLYFAWWLTYSIRERWQLILKENTVEIQQLLPRPFTFFSRVNVIPLSKIEGITVGPRAFRSILLVGVFVATNLGVTFLKSGFSEDNYDAPETLDALFLVMKEITFLPFLGELAQSMDDGLKYLFEQVAPRVMLILGIVFLVIGALLVIFSIPRRNYLIIRVRYGNDFFINGGVNRRFWNNLYRKIYADETFTNAPETYKKLDYPWLKDEVVESVADLEQTIYFNRIISVFALYVGISRILERILDTDTHFFDSTGDNSVYWWVTVASVDMFIAAMAVRFSKKKNEMIISNKRVLFVIEEPDISGTFGKRLYNISDIRRDDVAGFDFKKITAFSPMYLLATVFVSILLGTYFSDLNTFMIVLFGILILVLISFINETYLEFTLKTKGYEIWKLRHQLSNPATILRNLIGNDTVLVNTLLTNRLEEKEIIDAVKVIRRPYLSHLVKNEPISEPKQDVKDDAIKLPKLNLQSQIRISVKDLLFEGEDIEFETNVSRKIPRRKFNLTIASLIMIGVSSLAVLPFILLQTELDIPEIQDNYGLIAVYFVFFGVALIVMILLLWMRFFSLHRASFAVTEERVFFQDRKAPIRLLYFLGVNNVTEISEVLRSQIHSTYSSRQYNQKYALRAFIRSFIYFNLFSGLSALFGVGGIELISRYEQGLLDQSFQDLGINIPQIILIIMIITMFSGLQAVHHAGTAYVELIRGWPKRIFNAKGVNVHYTIPYAKSQVVKDTKHYIWNRQKVEVI